MLVNKNTNYKISVVGTDTIKKITISPDREFGRLFPTKSQFEFEYYTGNITKINVIVEGKGEYDVKITEKPFIISQMAISTDVRHFNCDYIRNRGLKNYENNYAPTIVYGFCEYTKQILRKNKSLRVLILAGSDALKFINDADKYKANSKIKYIANSSFISDDLKSVNIKHTFVPIMLKTVDNYYPFPKGPKIYMYFPPYDVDKYTNGWLDELIDKYGRDSFIFAVNSRAMSKFNKSNKKNIYNVKSYNSEELFTKIYPQCFIYLRLTKHDGLAKSVQEFGAMGIKSVFNGKTPSALPYETIQDVFDHIDRESKTIGQIDYELSDRVKSFLKYEDDFRHMKYYLDS